MLYCFGNFVRFLTGKLIYCYEKCFLILCVVLRFLGMSSRLFFSISLIKKYSRTWIHEFSKEVENEAF